MDQQEGIDSNRAPVLNEEKYEQWSIRMRVYLQSLGFCVWNVVISDYIPPKRIWTTSQKESKKNNLKAMEAILDGLPQPIKEKIGQCISSKELWVKLEKLYLVEQRAEARLSMLKDGSKDAEILFIGITNLDEES